MVIAPMCACAALLPSRPGAYYATAQEDPVMNASAISAARPAAIAAAVERIRVIERSQGVTRDALNAIMVELKALAAQQNLFPSSEFPPPPDGEPGNRRYLLQEDPDHRFALYLNALNPGNESKPHDHTTWAVVVAVDGQELNKVYRRTADALVVDHEVMVEPGTGITLMPTDIHSIHTTGTVPTRHLHMYGLALEKLDNRMAYDPKTGEAIPYNANFMRPTATARA
jgi:predicted metal-dependent enzyme (double-stranded beta helix superfamily)